MKINVLDHGYVEFIEAWGHGKSGEDHVLGQSCQTRDFECGIIEGARQSTQGSFRGWKGVECSCPDGYGPDKIFKKPIANFHHLPDCKYKPGDEDLLEFLYSHKHFTPFEFAGMVIEVQAPIFVFREWHRHRTQSYNEMSARYAPLPDLYYIPDRNNVIQRTVDAGKNKQATGIRLTSDLLEAGKNTTEWLDQLQHLYQEAEATYKAALDSGIPKELARLCMPVGHYSRMRASANLRNWLQFLTLRCDPAAQWEIRQFAAAVAQIVERFFPKTYDLWAHSDVLE